MNLKHSLTRILTLAGLALAAQTGTAHAFTITGSAGQGFGSGPAHNGLEKGTLLLGGELTFGLGNLIQVGGFYDYNNLTIINGGNASVNFYGIVARVGIPMTGIFFDAKAGSTSTTSAGFTTDSAMGFGAGVGYHIGIAPLVSINPHLGYRSLPYTVGSTSQSRSVIDANLLISFSLL